MEKKIVKSLIISAVIILIVITCLIIRNNLGKLSNDEKHIIIENSYFNLAWGLQYRGSAIFNDGSIYIWNVNGNNDNFTANNMKELNEWIIKNGDLQEKKVSKKDLEKIKKLIINLKDIIETEQDSYDAGEFLFKVYKYDDNKEIILSMAGDFSGENKTKESKEIRTIVNKYLDYY